MSAGTISPQGDLVHQIFRPRVSPWPAATDRGAVLEHGLPRPGLSPEVNFWRAKNQRHLLRGWRRIAAARVLGVPTYYGALWVTVRRGATGEVVPYGLASLRVVTTAGVNKIVSVLNTADAVTAVNFKFHGYGTGVTAEAAADTALVTELTTQYNPDNTRPTGTQTVGGASNIYRTVATMTPDSGGSIVLREHGIFSANTAGTLLDRSLFAAITLDSTLGDSIQTTYDLTLPAGS